jgi:hypothetical protein
LFFLSRPLAVSVVSFIEVALFSSAFGIEKRARFAIKANILRTLTGHPLANLTAKIPHSRHPKKTFDLPEFFE